MVLTPINNTLLNTSTSVSPSHLLIVVVVVVVVVVSLSIFSYPPRGEPTLTRTRVFSSLRHIEFGWLANAVCPEDAHGCCRSGGVSIWL